MESLLVNVIIGFWLVLFGAMAIFPFVMETRATRRTPVELTEDQIISIQPVAPASNLRPITSITSPSATGDHRQAA
jgi:hypothetical protein